MSLSKYLYSANWRGIEAKRLYTVFFSNGHRNKKLYDNSKNLFQQEAHMLCKSTFKWIFPYFKSYFVRFTHSEHWAQPIIIFALGELCFIALNSSSCVPQYLEVSTTWVGINIEFNWTDFFFKNIIQCTHPATARIKFCKSIYTHEQSHFSGKLNTIKLLRTEITHLIQRTDIASNLHGFLLPID